MAPIRRLRDLVRREATDPARNAANQLGKLATDCGSIDAAATRVLDGASEGVASQVAANLQDAKRALESASKQLDEASKRADQYEKSL